MDEETNVSKTREKLNLQLLKLQEASEFFFKSAKYEDCNNYLERLKQNLDSKACFRRLFVDSNRLCCQIMIEFRKKEPCYQTLRHIYYEYAKIALKIQSSKPSIAVLSLELSVVYNLCWLGIVLNSDNEIKDEFQRICLFSLRRSIENGSNTDVRTTKSIEEMIYEAVLLERFDPDPMFIMSCWCLIVSSSSDEILKLVSSLKLFKEVNNPLIGFVSSGNVCRVNSSYLMALLSYSNAFKSNSRGEFVDRKELAAIENEIVKPFSSYLNLYLSKDETDFNFLPKVLREFSNETRSEFLNAIGCLVAAKGKRQLALQYFKEAIRNTPNETGTVLSLFNVSVQFKCLDLRDQEMSALELVLRKIEEEINISKSSRSLRQSMSFKNNETNKDVLNAVASRLFSNGSYLEAADVFTKLKSLYFDTSDAKFREILLRVLYSLIVCGRDTEASEMTNELDEDPVSSFLNGVLLIRKNRFSDAMPLFKCLVDEVSQENVDSYRSKRFKTGSGLEDDSMDQIRSLAYCNMGLINVAIGKPLESVRYLEMSHRLYPGNPDILYNYCLTLISTGNDEKAYKLWNSKRSSCNLEAKDVSKMDLDRLDAISRSYR